MKRLARLTAAVLCFAVLACTETPTDPELPDGVSPLLALQIVVVQRFDISGTRFSQCTFENIAVTGTVRRLRINIVSDGSTQTLGFYSLVHLAGTGEISGDGYTLNSKENFGFHDAFPQQTNDTFALSTLMVSHGPSPNQIAHLLIHSTFANGELRVRLDFDSDFTCVG